MATFSEADVALTGPTGLLPVASIESLSASLFRVHFTPLADRGSYQAVIGPNIADLAGNPMNQDNDGVNGEAIADQFTASFRLIVANVIFTVGTTISESNTTYEGQDILIEGAQVAIDGTHQFNSVHLINGAVLTHTANTATLTHKVDLSVAEQIIVDATSRIDVTSKGYLPGRTTGNTTLGGATGHGGGSYGGRGASNNGSTNAVYGDYADPSDWGSGSGSGPNGNASKNPASATRK